jgi:transposase
MLQQSTREAILLLHDKGQGIRTIARTLGISRGAVRTVLNRGTAEVPLLARQESAQPYREDILELYHSCKRNLVRVHEQLLSRGASVSYPALTAFCRKHELVRAKPLVAGQYHFEPGQEMQHDTSPHQAHIGGKLCKVQTASAVLCYSRMIFIQLYPSFTRFECKLFLTDALRYFGGACKTCMIDNTHVVVLRGTGADMMPVPEMAAFAERYDFSFRAHEKGDANRSGRVERPFDFVDNNFLAGRQFADLRDANRQAVAWCDKVNSCFKRHLHSSARELFAVEQPLLRALPAWVPEVYLLHHRIVDVEGYVCVRSNRYSAPYQLMGRRVEVSESKERIDIYLGPRKVAEHQRLQHAHGVRVCLPEHRPQRGQGRGRKVPCVQEQQLLKAEPALGQYVLELKNRASGNAVPAMRRLLRMLQDYPREPLLQTVAIARHYGLYNLERLEQMLLRQLREQYFVLPQDEQQAGGDDDDDDDDENR